MILQHDTNNINAYINNRLKISEDIRKSLQSAINKLEQHSYKYKERVFEPIVREKVTAIIAELGQYHSITRSFTHGKGGDIGAFKDILIFFNNRYFENNSLTGLLDQLTKVLETKMKPDLVLQTSLYVRNNADMPSQGASDLEKWLLDFKKNLLQIIDPILLEFLADVNEIVLYYDIKKAMPRLIDSNHVFNLGGQEYLDFTKCSTFFIEYQIKLTRNYMSPNEMEEMMNRMLQQMGFRSAILKSRNIDPEKYREILAWITGKVKQGNFDNTLAAISRNAVNAIRSIEKKNSSCLN